MGTAAVGYLLAVLSGWRNLMIAMGVVALVVAAAWFLTYKEKEGAEFKKSDAPFLEPLKKALKLKEVWLLALGWARHQPGVDRHLHLLAHLRY